MNIYNLVINIYFDLSDLYCLGMATDLSQSLDLSIYRYKDYILVISAADRVDSVLPYLLMTVDRCIYDIGSKINDMSSAPSRPAIIYRFNHEFFVSISCWLQDQINWHAHTFEGELWTYTGVKQISQALCFHINTLLARPVGPVRSQTSVLTHGRETATTTIKPRFR